MKSKIFYVIIIATSIAVIVGLALTGNNKVPDGQLPAGNERQVAQPAPASSPVQTSESLSEDAIKAKNARMEQAALSQEQAKAVVVDRVDRLRSSVHNPVIFSSLNIRERVSALSLELKMNEEQEVLLASYLEARDAFMNSSETKYFASSIMSYGLRSSQGSSNPRPEATLDQMSNYVEIMNLELKEIKALREKFRNELTKQQRETFDVLPITATL
jgi:hypothetical protein